MKCSVMQSRDSTVANITIVRAMAQAVSRRPLTAESRVRSQVKSM
jgi:hypothetical protein